MLTIIQIVTAVLLLVVALVRMVESIYQLSQKPGLSTLGKCIQVIKNFFTLETYNVR